MPLGTPHAFFFGLHVVTRGAYGLAIASVVTPALSVRYPVVGLCCFALARWAFDAAEPTVPLHDLLTNRGGERTSTPGPGCIHNHLQHC